MNVAIKKEAKQAVHALEVDKTAQTVKAFGKAGELLAFFPASVGSDEKPTPSGVLKVTSIDARPNYRYNPDYKFKGVKSKEAFTINPGPNNPAGAHWIGLSSESYGIHGTPNPSKVSKSELHGCVRLTNWDVDRLAKLLKKGTEVAFIERAAANKKRSSRRNAARSIGRGECVVDQFLERGRDASTFVLGLLKQDVNHVQLWIDTEISAAAAIPFEFADRARWRRSGVSRIGTHRKTIAVAKAIAGKVVVIPRNAGTSPDMV